MARNEEARIQAAIVKYFRYLVPEHEGLIYHTPNGGLRTASEAALLKWTGTLAGVPDLTVLLPRGRAAFWEVKTLAGRLSEAQAEMHARLTALGFEVAVVRSIDDARFELARLGVRTQERAA